MSEKMTCYIYRCSRKLDMYIYLAEKDDFSKVPEAVMKGLGNTEFAMELELGEDSKLARENPVEVLRHLKDNGFYIQLPDDTSVEELMSRIARQTSHH